jgi:homocysteine S-methyltransferase
MLLSEWVKAGAEILLAPTLRATPEGLKPIGLAHRAAEVNRVLLDAARQAALAGSPPPWVAAQVGSLGATFKGGGFFTFDEAYIQYHEQVKAIALKGADLVVVRRLRDLRLLRAALVAVRELWSGLVVVILEPPLPGLPAGASAQIESAAEVIQSLDVQGIGLEGFADPEARRSAALALRARGVSLIATVLDARDGSLAGELHSLREAGVNLAILEGEDGLRRLETIRSRGLDRAGPAERVSAGAEPLPPGSLPEIAPRPRIKVSLDMDWKNPPRDPGKAADVSTIRGEPPDFLGIRIESGSVDLGREGWRRREIEERLTSVEKAGGTPLLLEVRDPLVLETGLKASGRRALIYLGCLDTALWQSVFYLSARYGARLAARLAPVPTRPGERCPSGTIQAIQRLLHASREYCRLSPEDIYVDPLGLDADGRPAWDQESLQSILKQMPPAKRETGVRWILDCHHFREGQGPIENPAYQAWVLSIALFQGLDAVVVAPDQKHLLEILETQE